MGPPMDPMNPANRPILPPDGASERLLFRPSDLADRCGVCEKTVRRWISHQGLPSVRLAAGGARPTLFIRPSDFAKWLDDRAVIEQSPAQLRRRNPPRPPRRFL